MSMRKVRIEEKLLCGFIANRVLPAAGTADGAELRRLLEAEPALADLPAADVARAAVVLGDASAYLQRLGQAQKREIGRLAHDAPGIDITPVPLLVHDVSNLASLRTVADCLAGGAS